MIEKAIARSREDHVALQAAFQQGDFDFAPAPPISRFGEGEAARLVARLVDGNRHVPANNRLVARLEELGDESMKPLLAAVRDPIFRGRGYAAYALGRVMKNADCKTEEGVDLLNATIRECLKKSPYVVGLAVSGLKLVGEKPRLDDDD